MKTKSLLLGAVLLVFIVLIISMLNKPQNRFRLQRIIAVAGSFFNSSNSIDTISATSDNTAVDLSFLSADGKIVSLNDLKGKTVFINFWATWCSPCIAEMPSINRLHQKLSKQKEVVFLMVDVDGNLSKSMAFMKNNQYDLPVYIPNSTIPPTLLGRGIPVTVIFSPDGKMAFRQEGGGDYDRPEILSLLTGLK